MFSLLPTKPFQRKQETHILGYKHHMKSRSIQKQINTQVQHQKNIPTDIIMVIVKIVAVDEMEVVHLTLQKYNGYYHRVGA